MDKLAKSTRGIKPAKPAKPTRVPPAPSKPSRVPHVARPSRFDTLTHQKPIKPAVELPPMPLLPEPPSPPTPPAPEAPSVKAYWHACTNFGDAMTPYLIEKISGEPAQFVQDNSDPSLVMVTGSLLSYNVKRGVIWGSGSAFKDDLNPDLFTKPSGDFRIIATRGLLSRKYVRLSGHDPVACGDPGLLLPRFYTPNVTKKYDVGVMCSWVDYEKVSAEYKDEKITIINSMYGSVEDIINKICECEVLITSTLHGLVAAIAYGVPTVSVKFSDKMIGDGFKYEDFLSCTDAKYDQIDLRSTVLTKQDLMDLAFVHNVTVSTDDLLNCCPFKK